MSSLDSYRRALTDLVDGQRRLTAELKRLKENFDERTAELLSAKESHELTKSRVFQFVQFLSSSPQLRSVLKCAEMAQLLPLTASATGSATSSSSAAVIVTASDLLKHYLNFETSNVCDPVDRRASLPTQSRKHSSISPLVSSSSPQPLSLAPPASRDTVTSSVLGGEPSSSTAVESAGASSSQRSRRDMSSQTHTTAPTESKFTATDPLRTTERQVQTVVDASGAACTSLGQLLSMNNGALAKDLIPDVRMAASLARDLPGFLRSSPRGVDALALSLVEHRATAAGRGFALESRTGLAKSAAGSPPPPHSHVSPSSTREASDGPVTTKGDSYEERWRQQQHEVEQLRRQLAVSQSITAKLRQESEKLVAKNVKLQCQVADLAGSRKAGAFGSPSPSPSILISRDGAHGGVESSNALPRLQLASSGVHCLPASPRPPPLSRPGGNTSRSGRHEELGRTVHHLTVATSSTLVRKGFIETALRIISYFVEDFVLIIRESREALADLNSLHDAVLQWTPSNLPSPTTAANATPTIPFGQSNVSPLTSLSGLGYARLMELMNDFSFSLEEPRFADWKRFTWATATEGEETHQISDMVSMLLTCWSTLRQFLAVQVQHTQTTLFFQTFSSNPMLAALLPAAAKKKRVTGTT